MILTSRPTNFDAQAHHLELIIETLAEMQVDLLDLTKDELDAERQRMVMELDACIDILQSMQ